MKTVDFYYDFSSTNSYFAAFLLPELCARLGAEVNWLPLHLAALFRGTGFDVMAMTARKARYLWRDHARYGEFTGLPFRKPSRFPIKTALALRAVLSAGALAGGGAAGQRARAELSQALMRAYWERDEDIAEPAVLAGLARKLAIDPGALLAAAASGAARDELRAITARAAERQVFGAPTFFVGEEMFWGKDRIDFVARELARG
jgi:2-hydroxychromene-2-carboxylate isomerase